MKQEENIGSQNEYPLPLVIVPTLPVWQTVLMCVSGPIMLASPFLHLFDGEKDGSLLFRVLMFYILIPVSGALITFIAIPTILLKKNRFRIDDAGIRSFSLFGDKKYLWSEFSDVTTFAINGVEFFGFITHAKAKKLERGGFGSILASMMGGIYEVSIPIKKLGGLDKDRVMLTIKKVFEDSRDKQRSDSTDSTLKLEEEVSLTAETITNYPKAFLNAFGTATAVAILYFASFLVLGINFALLPIIGIAGIAHYFSKRVKPSDYNIVCRLYISLIGVYSIFVVRIALAFYDSSIPVTPLNLISVCHEYFFVFLRQNLIVESIWLMISAVAAGIGFTMGPSIGLFQRIKSTFLRRLGRIQYQRDGAYYTLYIIPAENFDENQEKFMLEIPKGCEIELDGNRPIYFKFPLSVIMNENIIYPSELFSVSLDGRFLELNLGGAGKTIEYAYDTILTCSAEKEIETISIETH